MTESSDPDRDVLPKDLVAASAVPLVLAILSEGDSYGYAIIRRIREVSKGTITWSEGMLYPVLHKLAGQDHVETYWEKSETGRKRKYYRITRTGTEVLKQRMAEWAAVTQTMDALGGTHNGIQS